MTSVKVLHNQSFLDIAIQHTGSVVNAFIIAKANGYSISDEPETGTVLIIPEDVHPDNDILNYYTSKNIHPATAITGGYSGAISPQPEGIDYWAIYDDFIVQ
ncbi:MAG: hypothetical protein QM564_11735 [Bergeyella sp.]